MGPRFPAVIAWAAPLGWAAVTAASWRAGRADAWTAVASVLVVVLGLGGPRRAVRSRGGAAGAAADLLLVGGAVAWLLAGPASHRTVIALGIPLSAAGLGLAGCWRGTGRAGRGRLAVLGAAAAGVVLATGVAGAPAWPLKAALVALAPPVTAALLVPLAGPLLALVGSVALAAAVGPAHAAAWLLPPLMATGLLALARGRVAPALLVAVAAALLPPAGLAVAAGLAAGAARRRRSPIPLLVVLPALGLALWRLPAGVPLLATPSLASLGAALPLTTVSLPWLLPVAVLGLGARGPVTGEGRDVLGAGLLVLPFVAAGPWTAAAVASLWLGALPAASDLPPHRLRVSLPWTAGAALVLLLGSPWGLPAPLAGSGTLLAGGWAAALLLGLVPHPAAALAWVLAAAGLVWTVPVEGADRVLRQGEALRLEEAPAGWALQAGLRGAVPPGAPVLGPSGGGGGALLAGVHLPVPGAGGRHPMLVPLGRGRSTRLEERGVETRRWAGTVTLVAGGPVVVRAEPASRWKARKRRFAVLMGGALLLLLAALAAPRAGPWPATVGLVVVLGGLVAAGSGLAALAGMAWRHAADLAAVGWLAAALSLRHMSRRRLLAGFLLLAPLALAQPVLRHPAGDEVYSLLLDRSLMADGDLDISNNIDPGDPSERIYLPHAGDLIHSPLPAVAALPLYAVAGHAGALLLTSLLMALAAWAAARRAEAVGVPRRAVDAAWAATLLGAPCLLFATQLWPAAFGAAAAGVLLLLAARPAPGAAAVTAAASLLVKVRLGLLTLPLAGAALLRARRARAAAILVGAVAAAVTLVALLLGGPLGRHSLAELLPGSTTPVVVAAWGLLWDAAGGLAFAAPLWLVALVFLPRVWRRGGMGERALVVGAALTVAALLPRGEWYGGGSPPARYLVPLLPLALLGLAEALRSSTGRRLAALALPLAAVSAWVAVTRPLWWFNPVDGGWWLADRLARALGANTLRLFPSLIRPDPAALAVPVAILLLAAWWVRGRRAGAGAVALAALAVTVGWAAGMPEWTVDLEDPQVHHDAGRAEPPPGTFFRAARGIAWRLGPGESIRVPWRPAAGGRLTVRVRVPRSAPGPGRLLASWEGGSVGARRVAGPTWRRVPLPEPPGFGRRVLRLAWEGPEGSAVLLDRVESRR